VAVDLAEINHTPWSGRSPPAYRTITRRLLRRSRPASKCWRPTNSPSSKPVRPFAGGDFERERVRCERLMAEILKTTAELMGARDDIARVAGEFAAYQARPWWRRLVG
jgi:hypothetical protein